MKTENKNLTATGDCYEAALKAMYRLCSDGDASRYRLVHAEVIGQGPIDGVAYGHAFVVDVLDEVVIDESNGKQVVMPICIYEALGRIHVHSNTHAYQWDEVVEKVLEHDTYGPWDLVTSTGY